MSAIKIRCEDMLAPIINEIDRLERGSGNRTHHGSFGIGITITLVLQTRRGTSPIPLKSKFFYWSTFISSGISIVSSNMSHINLTSASIL